MSQNEAILRQKREELATLGVKHKGRSVPFGITLQQLELPEGTAERIRNAGNVVGRFLTAVNTLLTDPDYTIFRQGIPELQALLRPNASHINSVAPHIVPSMFRLDLIVEPDGGFKTSEIELLFGGIGYNEVIRNHLFPTNPSRSIGVSFATTLNFLSGGRKERCSIVTVDWEVIKPYLHDLDIFAQSVRRFYPDYDVVFSKDLRLDSGGNLVSVDNPDPIRLVHRFFEIYMGASDLVEGFDTLLEAYQRGTARDLPSLKQCLEEKLL